MKSSVFGSMGGYAREMLRGMRSIWQSSVTVLPYLMNVRSGELRKEVTEQYPDPVSSRTAEDLPPRTRGLLNNDIEKCTGCKECELVCPVRCIRVEAEPGPDPSKTWVSVFDIDHGRCIFCGICVEVCQPASLTHTRRFEGAVFELKDLVSSFGRGHISPDQRTHWERQRYFEDQDEEDSR